MPCYIKLNYVNNIQGVISLQEKLELLKNKLSNISKGNKAVKLTKIHAKNHVDLYTLNNLRSTKCSTTTDILNWLISKKKKLFLISNESNEENALAFCGYLNNLYKNLKFIEGETGQYNLCIGYPFIKGYTNDNNYIQAPILLYPVRLEKVKDKANGWVLNKLEDEGFILNKALFMAIGKANEKFIDEKMFDDVLELKTDNIDEFISTLMMKFYLNTTIKDKDIVDFDEYNVNEYPKVEKSIFDIAKYMILGRFSLSDSSISKDYSGLIKLCETDTEFGLLEDLLLEDQLSIPEYDQLKEYKQIDEIDECEKFFIADIDASQEEVIIASEIENGITVDGPPGTGKSQVIANLISNHLAKGEKILVVSQKRVALDVVYSRLESVGLDEYCALIHDTKEDKQPLYKKIEQVIENTLNNEELIRTKTEYEELARKIKNITDNFNTIEKALKQEQDFGISAGKIYSHCKKPDCNIELLSPAVLSYKIDYNFLNEFQDKIKNLGDYHNNFGVKHHPLYERKSFSELNNTDIYEIKKSIRDLITEYHELSKVDTTLYPKLHENDIKYVQNEIYSVIKLLENYNYGIKDKISFLLWRLKNGKKLLRILNNSIITNLKFDELRKHQNTLLEFNLFIDKLMKIEEILRVIHMKEDFTNKLRNDIDNGDDITELLNSLLNSLNNDSDNIIEMDNLISNLDEIEMELYKSLTGIKDYDENDNLGVLWQSCLKDSIYLKWIDECEKKIPELKWVTTGQYDKLLKEYTNTILEKKSLTPKYLKYKLAERSLVAKNKLPQGEVQTLLREVTKKKQSKPIRKLIEQYHDIGIFDFIPIWLVTPETVSSIFPLKKQLFDLVIFDEASQCNVEDAMPALYRARRAVIAGDDKQLPPCNIGKDKFINDEDESENSLIDSESLLDLSKIRFIRKPLCWHYRSKYEELINFSNHAFYGGSIQIAPNVSTFTEEKAINWIKVPNGFWQNGYNEIEAKEVVQVLKKTLSENRDKSIGIIAFNKEQAERIDKLIDREIQIDPEFAALYSIMMSKDIDKRLFVKNIENVQGDERQFIIFSATYGREENGRITRRYGDLNNQGGENKLNVAISRATENIIMVSSIEPHEMDVSSCKNQGPYLFKKYLEYAQAVSDGNKERAKIILKEVNPDMKVQNKEELHFDSPFEEEVYDSLKRKGYALETQVGCSGYRIDQAIIHPNIPGRFILGIECDGATYHSARCAKERDIYRQRFLESKGWQIIRIWSRNWWANPEKELQRIESKIKELI